MEGFKMKSDFATLGAAQKSFSPRVVIRKWLILSAIALLVLPFTKPVNAQGLLYTVDTTSDTVVIGACENGNPGCSLRGAIGTANAHVGDDGIGFDLPAGSVINLTGVLPDITESVSIIGPGPDQLTVRRDTGGDYRIFTVATTGTVSFSGLTINNGSVTAGNSGGGIQIASNTVTVNVTNCTLSLNVAVDSGGGGIANGNGTVNVTNSTLSGNSAVVGGGISTFSGSTVNVTNSTLSGNFTVGGNGEGGGIFNDSGTVNVTNSTLSGNSAGSSGGGGIFTFGGGTVNVTNSTLSGNSTTGTGGGIDDLDSTVNVINSTLSRNSSAGTGNNGGGGIGISSGFNGPVNARGSIIALNTATSAFLGPDVFGPFTTQGYNLIGEADGSTGFTNNLNNDQVGSSASPLDPKLDPNGLQNNGGPTQTIALLFGSPAIDKATNGLTGNLITDQRGTGFPRTFDDPAIANAPEGDGTDIGAFEVQTAAPTPTPTPTTFGNISTRLRVETGDNVLIGGFIITGSQAKKVMVRAIGPSLPLAGLLANPTLELHGGTGALISSNDNWMDAPNKQEIIDSTIPPTNDLESAILMSLDPGLYTAIVRGVNDTTGIALVEAYDLDLGADSILANISTRGLVQTDDNVMIGGIIILGTDAQEVLLRAIGPSLPLTGALADPTLELHDKDGVIIASNDDWKSDQEAEIMATGIPPTDDAESAILMTLTPDAYTAIVRGKDNTTGVALVEAYQLDN
jgi:hypothetical protein